MRDGGERRRVLHLARRRRGRRRQPERARPRARPRHARPYVARTRRRRVPRRRHTARDARRRAASQHPRQGVSAMDDLLNEFLTETNESLGTLDVELVRFEREPSDAGILGNIFRLMHTIKGTCGFLGLPRLESVAHAGENVLGKFRDGEIAVTPGAVTLILKAIDRIREILGAMQETGAEPVGDDRSLIAELNAAASGE